MSCSPFFSVLLPIKKPNIENRRALLSIASQTFKDYELIVCVEDKDTFVSLFKDIIKSINYRIIPNKMNGMLETRMDCILASKGEYLLHIDDDDEYSSNKAFNIIHDALGSKPDIFFFNAMLYSDGAKKERWLDSSFFRPSHIDVDNVIKHCFENGRPYSLWNKAIKKNSLIRFLPKKIEGCNIGEDQYLLTPLLNSKDILIEGIDEVIYNYLTKENGSSLSVRKDMLYDRSRCLTRISKDFYYIDFKDKNLELYALHAIKTYQQTIFQILNNKALLKSAKKSKQNILFQKVILYNNKPKYILKEEWKLLGFKRRMLIRLVFSSRFTLLRLFLRFKREE